MITYALMYFIAGGLMACLWLVACAPIIIHVDATPAAIVIAIVLLVLLWPVPFLVMVGLVIHYGIALLRPPRLR